MWPSKSGGRGGEKRRTMFRMDTHWVQFQAPSGKTVYAKDLLQASESLDRFCTVTTLFI